VWLLNTEDDYETVLDFATSAHITLPMLYDAKAPYHRYYAVDDGGEPWAPYPLQVIVDRDGVIRYISHQYDALAVQRTLDTILSAD